jgi:hypothetical protein
VHQVFFDLVLDEDTEEKILEMGPIRLFGICKDDEVAIEIEIDSDFCDDIMGSDDCSNDHDLFVFGDLKDDSNLDGGNIDDFILEAHLRYAKDMWEVASNGYKGDNSPDKGAAWVTQGEDGTHGVWYVGIDGDSMIGVGTVSALDDTTGGIMPSNANCLIAGGLHVYATTSIYVNDIDITSTA